MDAFKDLFEQARRAAQPFSELMRNEREIAALSSMQRYATDQLRSPYASITAAMQARETTALAAYRAAVEARGVAPELYRGVLSGEEVKSIVGLSAATAAAQKGCRFGHEVPQP